MAEKSARGGIFFGWYVLAASCFVLFLVTGARNAFGVFIIPMTDDLGWSRSAISAAIAVGWFMNGVSQPFIGRAYDRLGGRKVIAISLLIVGLCTMLLSQVNSLWFLILVYGFVMSIASGGASFVTIHSVLAKWFYRRRGMVLSIGTAGASAGSLVLAPFATYLILVAGWRMTWGVLGLLIVVLGVPLALLIIRDDPAEIVIGVGAVSDRLGRKNLLGSVYTLRGLAYAILIFTPGVFGIWGFAVIAGFSWIATAPLTSSLTADIYGLRTMGTLNGLTTFAHQMGGALSIFMGGVLYDLTGGYELPFGIAGALLIGASLLSWSIREKKFSSRYQPAPPSAAPSPAPVGDGD